METILHKADTRGHANHGWLDSHHTFSFARYQNPERVRFGVLRVLNDDIVAPGQGFGTHPHENMEIISIPLEGDLEHKDSMGNVAVIRSGDVQVMSAGTGIYHSEYNRNSDSEVKFLQIWVFPHTENVEPRYGQITLDPEDLHNRLAPVVTPEKDGTAAWIHQNAWFHLGKFSDSTVVKYELKDPAHGLYLFVIEGTATVAGLDLDRRDGLGIKGAEQVEIIAGEGLYLLVMEVPL